MPTKSIKSERPQPLDRKVDELQHRVRELEVELERAHRLATLGTIAGSIAHEFNNILTPVMSYAQLALQSRGDHELVTRALQRAVDGTEKVAEIASAMLGFVRDDTECIVTDLALIAREAASCMGRDPAKDGIDLVIDIPKAIKVCIRPVALHQVILNIVLNAVEAIRPSCGKVVIQATIEPSADQNNDQKRVRITIADTGRGMAADQLQRIFSPFVTLRSPTSTRRGTGLGLAICRRLIEEAGGTIEVASQPGIGTTFTIVLPSE